MQGHRCHQCHRMSQGPRGRVSAVRLGSRVPRSRTGLGPKVQCHAYLKGKLRRLSSSLARVWVQSRGAWMCSGDGVGPAWALLPWSPHCGGEQLPSLPPRALVPHPAQALLLPRLSCPRPPAQALWLQVPSQPRGCWCSPTWPLTLPSGLGLPHRQRPRSPPGSLGRF